MNTISKKRAINDSDKWIKRQQLLGVAEVLLVESNFDAITMTSIATAAKVAKGTLFNYFETKEELFLAVLTEKYHQWFLTMSQQIGLLNKDSVDPIVFFSQMIRDTLHHEDSFYRLMAILHTKLEHNISYEVARQFKLFLADHISELAYLLCDKFSAFDIPKAFQFFNTLHCMIIGAMHMADTPPLISQVIEDEHLILFKVDFAQQLDTMLIHFLKGFLITEKGN